MSLEADLRENVTSSSSYLLFKASGSCLETGECVLSQDRKHGVIGGLLADFDAPSSNNEDIGHAVTTHAQYEGRRAYPSISSHILFQRGFGIR